MNKKRYLSPLFGIISIVLLVVSVFPLVRADTLDSYDQSNQSSEEVNSPSQIVGQCFRPTTNSFLLSASFMLRNPVADGGIFRLQVWSTQGTYGTTCAPLTGLSTSETFNENTIGTSFTIVTKNFIGTEQIALTANTAYVILLQGIDVGSLTMGNDNTAPSHAGNRFSCTNIPCGAAGDAAIDMIFSVQGVSTTSPEIITQCYANCGSTVNTNSTSSINFNITQTIFYKQQITQDGFAVNMSTVVGKSYPVSFGMRLYLGLYATDLSCPSLSSPFTPSCPGFLLRTESFNNPVKGTQTMFLNNLLKSGQFVGIAFSASRDGLVLNDTATNFSSFKTSGIMPAVITQFENNGNLKANLKLNLAVNVVVAPPPTGEVTPTLGDWLLDLIDNFSSGNRIAGGIFWFFAFSMGIIIGVPLLLSSHGADMPRGSMAVLIPFVFLGTSTMFTSLGALPAWVPILIFIIVAWMFSRTLTER